VFDLNNFDSFEKVFSYWLPEMLIKVNVRSIYCRMNQIV
jgi:hypothetical protein